jgi:hypothetical protein
MPFNKEDFNALAQAVEESCAQSKALSAATDRQIGGDHYKTAGIQPIEYIQANGLNFCEGNAVKYITRHRKKGGKQDLEKALHYLQMEIEFTYGKEGT